MDETGRREHQRFIQNLDIVYTVKGETHTSTVSNISKAGLFILSANPEREGTILELLLTLPDGLGVVKALAKVIWCRDTGKTNAGMGVIFSKIDSESKDLLEEFFNELTFS